MVRLSLSSQAGWGSEGECGGFLQEFYRFTALCKAKHKQAGTIILRKLSNSHFIASKQFLDHPERIDALLQMERTPGAALAGRSGWIEELEQGLVEGVGLFDVGEMGGVEQDGFGAGDGVGQEVSVTGPGGGEIDISGDDQGGGFNTC